jgi:probable rRNA maturation factor
VATGNETRGVDVDATDQQHEVDVDVDRYRRLLRDTLTAEGIAGPGEATLTFVDRGTIIELNETHMGSHGETDVLSFPVDGAADLPRGEHRMVGDIVVCPGVARDQAAEHAGDPDGEMALLVVHGALHLCGHDHADDEDRDRMWARERALLDDLWGPLTRDPWEP